MGGDGPSVISQTASREDQAVGLAGKERSRPADTSRTSAELVRHDFANSVPQLIWTCRPDGRCDFLNQRWVDYTGVPAEEQLGFSWLEQIHPDDRVPLMAAWNSACTSHHEFHIEYRLRRHDGAYHWFDTRAIPVVGESGELIKWYGSSTDIQEHYVLRERLREQSARLESLMASVPGIICSFLLRPDGTGAMPFASASLQDIYGLSLAEVVNDATPVFDRIPEPDRTRIFDMIGASARDRTPLRAQYRYLHPIKGERWMEGYARPRYEADGSILWEGVVLDVTERKREQDALRESERRLATQDVISRALAQATSLEAGCRELLRVLCEAEDWDCGGVWQIDPAGEALRCTECWQREDSPELTQFTAANCRTSFRCGVGALGRVWETRAPLWIPDIAADPKVERAAGALAAGLRCMVVFPIADGQTVGGAIELFARRSRTAAAPPFQLLDGISSQIHNFMVRVRAQHALRQSEQRLASVIEHMSEGLATAELDLRVTHWNPAALRMHDFRASDVAGKTLLDFLKMVELSTIEGEPIPFDDWPIPRILRGEILRDYEVRIRRLDRDWQRVFRYGGKLVQQNDGSQMIVLTISDITERVETSMALHRLNVELEERVSQRTAELEHANRELEAFSYSVSHDLRAPLRAMIGYSQILLEDYAASLPAEALRLVKTIGQSGKRMGALIDDLLALARLGRKELQLRHVEMRELVESVLEQERFEGRERTQLVVHALPPCYGDVQLLRQVWVNLLSNAFKYAQARDPIRIEIGSERSTTGDPIYFVRDNGAGFDMRYADKLFGVLQRLHGSEEFEGTGLGLAIVQRIVQRHGGRVWGEGAVNAGARFAFSLPASSERGQSDSARSRP
jgi:PAS domain S-box-containing protein